ncbi:MAG: TfoX/Sxy family protein [Acidimicrobiia bacterium]|nr:TfoX/Sxy family protein [Acidimicrobiia bacterium]MBT8216050.1 TfoX/Sxy family protein [Acidimicrobiia bacterium]NNF11340.1 TfoX/Sxy family protein [Acidimicrobiia bacterium]NNL71044.1 TfoX/Sxy family protein [Acidimicrobiia bacterium]
MAPDSFELEISDTIRRMLSGRGEVSEKRIVGGGLGFMVDGHLCCGISRRGLTVRVGPDGKESALQEPHVRPLAFGKREAAAFIVVEPAGLRDGDAVADWVERGLRFVATLS